MPRIVRSGQKCGCQQMQFSDGEWINCKCPFRIGDVDRYRMEGMEAMVGIYCQCGSQVGEICFAGKQHLGMWRMKRTVPESQLMGKIKHWLGNMYGSELKQIEEQFVELKKTIVRIEKGLNDQVIKG